MKMKLKNSDLCREMKKIGWPLLGKAVPKGPAWRLCVTVRKRPQWGGNIHFRRGGAGNHGEIKQKETEDDSEIWEGKLRLPEAMVGWLGSSTRNDSKNKVVFQEHSSHSNKWVINRKWQRKGELNSSLLNNSVHFSKILIFRPELRKSEIQTIKNNHTRSKL